MPKYTFSSLLIKKLHYQKLKKKFINYDFIKTKKKVQHEMPITFIKIIQGFNSDLKFINLSKMIPTSFVCRGHSV